MNGKSLWRYAPPAGPLLSLMLIGLVMLSALLYYRAVKIQRFLEPALALSQPRNEFAKSINQIFRNEFGTDTVQGIKVRSSSILMDRTILFNKNGTIKATAKDDLHKLAEVFVALLNDNTTRANISLILVIARYPAFGPHAPSVERLNALLITGFIQDVMAQTEPQLLAYEPAFFVSAAQAAHPPEANSDIVEFRIVPSEFLHIKVLEKLEKYSL